MILLVGGQGGSFDFPGLELQHLLVTPRLAAVASQTIEGSLHLSQLAEGLAEGGRPLEPGKVVQ